MTIRCALCGRELRSPKPQPEEAQKALLELMTIHLREHPAEMEKTKVMLQLMATYILFQYIDIPPEEIKLMDYANACEEAVASILGFEPETEAIPK